MKKDIVVIAPHPDDETLGCGGTLLVHKEKGDKIHWIIVTKMGNEFERNIVNKRMKEIEKVSALYGFDTVNTLEFDAAKLDHYPLSDIVKSISLIFNKLKPNTIYVPFRYDVHSDHKVVFDAAIACTKSFRYPSIERVLAYETLSETDFSLNLNVDSFKPNVFQNITNYLEEKIKIMNIYETEIDEHPFPRSEKSIRALAYLRGSSSGFYEAEAFMLLKERLL